MIAGKYAPLLQTTKDFGGFRHGFLFVQLEGMSKFSSHANSNDFKMHNGLVFWSLKRGLRKYVLYFTCGAV